ncbi:putative O-linked N-acetylglucosamine transferase, SPINDLY family [Synechococcus sp. PCC 7502]|uniref:O-linked N-acetylglucosamine transferase, SPINDLY family protein n=1 Tax=Synechococcus sp. PCC 7502 TaxID=1173263 RepID=UPI00029F9E77|nr:O-linked N-acetylglucosamine transferase [Synechococcus sp. PCC 7502]AFY73051.1 putative O-linked N-acetylglucosamine transferase, SPINDLY family [Synechococcus sp. PCC 7502]
MTWEDLITESDNDYAELVNRLERFLEDDLGLSNNYQYLGLAYIFLEQQEHALDTWACGLKEASDPVQFTKDLQTILNDEADRQEQIKEYQVALNIRKAFRQLFPEDLNNVVQSFYLYLPLRLVSTETYAELNLESVIEGSMDRINSDPTAKNLLLQLYQNILCSVLAEDLKFEFISWSFPQIREKEAFVNVIIGYINRFRQDLALTLLDILQTGCLEILGIFTTRVEILLKINSHQMAIREAKEFLVKNQASLNNHVVANHLLLGALLRSGGKWQDAERVFEDHKKLIAKVIKEASRDIPEVPLSFIMLSAFFAPYFSDTPRPTRSWQNQISQLFQANIQVLKSELTQLFQARQLERRLAKNSIIGHRKLKIGFLSTTLRLHSVGWLARYLIQYLDREQFEIYGYFPEYYEGRDFLQEWYVGMMHKVFRNHVEYWGNHFRVAEEINRDEIDILIDLESTTSGLCTMLVALKPAPIQVTWLGWDASGIPAIDYYIADSFVLPDNAQEYYTEKIWRLPHCYLAVDGFEASSPTLTREQLEVPANGIIYFSSQKSDKRHPETVRLQMQILKQVPNSYFLIKGLSDQNSIKDFFYEMAELEGVNRDQLRFLPYSREENEHRGNLPIADVVLDTYPYNGATTTMEVLWSGIPLVTRVGEQFAARNSYTMMMNAGISEGIAWTPEEYVAWGVRFGLEEDLRRDVAWKLKQSRKTSPLWNARQFTREFETALKEMWEIHNG